MKDKKKEVKKVPIKIGDIVDLECISIGKKGDGIFKKDGFVVIAPKVEVNKKYKLKIMKVFKSIAFAEVMQNDVA